MLVVNFHKHALSKEFNYSYSKLKKEYATLSSREMLTKLPLEDFEKYNMYPAGLRTDDSDHYRQHIEVVRLYNKEFEFYIGYIEEKFRTEENFTHYRYLVKGRDNKTLCLNEYSYTNESYDIDEIRYRTFVANTMYDKIVIDKFVYSRNY